MTKISNHLMVISCNGGQSFDDLSGSQGIMVCLRIKEPKKGQT